jgi:hypothetical protein
MPDAAYIGRVRTCKGRSTSLQIWLKNRRL